MEKKPWSAALDPEPDLELGELGLEGPMLPALVGHQVTDQLRGKTSGDREVTTCGDMFEIGPHVRNGCGG